LRAISHLFLSRSRAAVFWFLVTCGSIGGSAYYVQSVTANERTRPQYVMGDSPELYYLAPDLDVDTPTELHAADTRLAMETIFNRSPSRLDQEDRLPRLFTSKAIDQIRAAVIDPQAEGFHENQLHQKVEMEDTIVNIQEGMGEATTVATGQLIRTGVSGNRTINENWSVKVFFTWKSNPNIEDHAMYPTVCDSVTFFSMERISP
jgi:hypothetical protein